MSNIILVALLQVSALGVDQPDYNEAYRQSVTTGRPLLVLIGAVWCPACQKMRNSVLPQVARTGGLDGVVFAYVDYDEERELASHLSRGTSIPQLIRFEQTPAGWKSTRLVGATSPQKVHSFVNAGLIDRSNASEASTANRPEEDPRKSASVDSRHPAPAAPGSRTYSSVDAQRLRQRQGGTSLAEEIGSLSRWTALLGRLFPESRSQHARTAYQWDQSSRRE